MEQETDDYYILFGDISDPTPIDYVERRFQWDLFLADKRSYVWGYVGELNEDQLSAVQTKLTSEVEAKLYKKHKREYSGPSDCPPACAYYIDPCSQRGQDCLAQVSPNLAFLSSVSPHCGFMYYPDTIAEDTRLRQALESLSEKRPHVEWSRHDLVNLAIPYAFLIEIVSLGRLMECWDRVKYCRSVYGDMDVLRHTAAACIICGTLKDDFGLDVGQIDMVEAISPNITAKIFKSSVHDRKKYIPSLELHQLEVLEECVDIAKSIRRADGCDDDFENVYEIVAEKKRAATRANVDDCSASPPLTQAASVDNPDPVSEKDTAETKSANDPKTPKQSAVMEKPKTKTPPTRNSGKEYQGRKLAAVKYAIDNPGVHIHIIELEYELSPKTLSRKPYSQMIKNGRTLTIDQREAISKEDEIEFHQEKKLDDTKRKPKKPLTKEEIKERKLEKAGTEFLRQAENAKKSAKNLGEVR